MNKPSIQEARLYVIVDRSVLKGKDPVEVAAAAVRGGADVIQWRDKESPDLPFLETARRLRNLLADQPALFIVNDRVAVALAVKADGLHVGHEDLPVPEARALVGRSMLIGRSTHSLQEALEAEKAGADYIGVGPVFSTPTKPGYKAVGLDLVRQVKPKIGIPWVAIGGIDLENIGLVSSAGAARVAVVRAVAAASDPEAAARSLKGKLSA